MTFNYPPGYFQIKAQMTAANVACAERSAKREAARARIIEGIEAGSCDLSPLPGRERLALKLRFWRGLSYARVGQGIRNIAKWRTGGVTGTRARQIINLGLRKLIKREMMASCPRSLWEAGDEDEFDVFD